MITDDAWTLFLELLSEIYFWADSKTIINFAGYTLSLVDLWGSACVICIIIEAIFIPLFGSHGFNITTKSKEVKNND